jgi:hypothetical protein
VPNYIVMYSGKTNPSVWLEVYHLTCRAGGADSDLFIIQFLPIYLADMSRAWLDHLPISRRCNFKGTYVWPGNP